MSKQIERDFYQRDAEEQQDFLKYTWCNQCQEVDLGMKNPVEYELNSTIYIEGDCLKCGSKVTTELQFEDDD